MTRQGFSILELLVVMAVAGIIMGIAALNLKPLQGDLQNSTSNLAGHMKKVRARAMASTSAYHIVYVSPSELRAEVSVRCSDNSNTWQDAPGFGFVLEEPVTLVNNLNEGDEMVCFSSRGLANASPTFTLRDDKGKKRRIELFRGGAVEVR